MKIFASLVTSFIVVAQPAAAFDGCLAGVWNANLDDLAHVLGAQLNGNASHVGGQATMQVSLAGDTTMLVDNVVFNIEMPGVPPMDITIVGYSSGTMSADEGSWVFTAGDYDLVGSSDVLGQTMTIPFTSATGVFGGGLGTYGCSTNSISFESTGENVRIPRNWSR